MDNRLAAADQRSFAALAVCVGTCLGGLALIVMQLARLDAASHVAGLVTQLCTTVAHIVMDLTSLFLAAVPAAVLSLMVLYAVGIRRRTRAVVEDISADRLTDVPAPVRAAAAAAGVTGKVDVVRCPDLLLFVHGYWKPKVVVSSAVVEQLTPQELVAVLCHEAHHLRRGDPLRMYVAEVAARSLFMFPVVADLRSHFAVATEIAADRLAIRHTNRKSLASALLKFESAPELAGTAALTGEAKAQARLAHLLDPELADPKIRVSAASLSTTLMLTVALTLLAGLLDRLPAM